MRYTAGHKEKTRARIVQAAGRVFRRLGYHAAGIDGVMEEAGLTSGGFYAHFASKEELFADALAPAAAEIGALRQDRLKRLSGRAWIEAFIERYLSASHRKKTEEGCPLPALVSEVARSGQPVKARFEAIILDLSAQIETHGGEGLAKDRALAIIALCVGGLAVARSVENEAFAERMLAACQELAIAGVSPDAQAETLRGAPNTRKPKGK